MRPCTDKTAEVHLVQGIIRSFGYPGIFLLMVAESACIPIPSEVTMAFAGFLAAQGDMNLAVAIALGTLGNLVGSYIAWGVGWVGGHPTIRRFGRLIWLREEDLDKAQVWFEKHGEAAVFTGRLLPVVRTFISLPAGAARMAPVRFGLFTIAGSFPWSAALAIAGYEVGNRWTEIVSWMSKATDVVAVIVVAVLVFAAWRLHKRRQSVVN